MTGKKKNSWSLPRRRLGWGIRLVQAMMLGCIPVVIQPGVHQYYQDFLPYRKWVSQPRATPPDALFVLHLPASTRLVSKQVTPNDRQMIAYALAA